MPKCTGIFFLLIWSNVYCQQRKTITIADAGDRKAIENASVTIGSDGKTSLAGNTDNRGSFSWTEADPESGMITVSYIGYQTLSVRYSPVTPLPDTLLLARGANYLEEVEVVSTGYQRLPRERSTGSFSLIGKEDLARYASRNAFANLDKLTSGIQFDRRGVQEGTDGISIRGRGTIYGKTSPLIILDDFPYDGNIEDIDPLSIESITVLKDAAAASIWGARASNGVIVISSIDGKKNNTMKVNVSSALRLGGRPDLENLNWLPAKDFIAAEQYLFSNGFYVGQENHPNKPVLSPVIELLIANREGQLPSDELERVLLQLENWDIRNEMKKYLYQNPYGVQNAVQLTGNNGKISQALHLGWDHNLGSTSQRDNRYTINSSHGFRWHKLQADLRLNYTFSDQKTGGLSYTDLTLGAAKRIYPYAQLMREDGTAATVFKDYRHSFVQEAMENGLADWEYRPIDENRQVNDRSHRHQGLANLTLRYPIFRGLEVEAKYQVSGQWNMRTDLKDRNSYYVRDFVNRFTQVTAGGELIRPVPYADILMKSAQRSYGHYWRGQLNYNLEQGDHQLTWIGGYERRSVNMGSDRSTIYGYNKENLTFSTVDLVSLFPMYYNKNLKNRISDGVSLGSTSDRSVSYYSNLGYTYKQRLSLSASLRKDGSNLFGVHTNQKFVPLWSVGASYEMSKEQFVNREIFRHLKWRLTYGYNGNVDNTLSSLPTMQYTSGQTFYPQLNYAVLVNPSNPDLRWEKTGTLNAGLDFALDCGLGGSIDLYRKKGTDLIGDTPLDPTLGVMGLGLSYGTFAYRGNIASMENTGIDLTLHGKISMAGVKWDHLLNLSYNNNKVTSYQQKNNLNGSFYVGSGTNINPIKGKPVYSIYSYPFAGLDGEGNPTSILNGERITDYNKILSGTTVDDLVYHGPAMAPWYGNYRTTLSYGAWSFSLALAYKFGFYFRRESVHYDRLFNSWSGHSDYTKRWQQPGDEARTTVPSMIYPNNSSRDNFYAGSDILVEKGDFIRLTDMRLDHRLFRNKVNCFVMVENLGFLWKRSKEAIDPETLSELRLPRIYSLGIKFSY